jgi:hypothetical protein
MIEFLNLLTYFGHLRIHMFDMFNTSTLAQDLWDMTCDFDVYVSLFWVTLDDLLVGYLGIYELKKK